MCDLIGNIDDYAAGLTRISIGYLGDRGFKQVKTIETGLEIVNSGKAGASHDCNSVASVTSDHHAFKHYLHHSADQHFRRWSRVVRTGGWLCGG